MSETPEEQLSPLSAYFMRVFKEHPEWLEVRTNEPVLTQFVQDHPGEEVTKFVRHSLSNVKALLRSMRARRKKR